jgi:Outer membrane lipoprotein carrier protein LolA
MNSRRPRTETQSPSSPTENQNRTEQMICQLPPAGSGAGAPGGGMAGWTSCVMPLSPVPSLFATAAFHALLASSDPAPGAPLPRELVALRESLQRTQKLSARFTQARHLAALHDGRLVWRTLPPAASELVLDGQQVTISYPGMGGAQTIDFSSEPGMGRVFETIRAVLQADLEHLESLFTLTVERQNPLSVALTPRTQELARTLRRIQLDFDARLRLVHIVLKEPDGDSTEISFRDHVIQTSAH